MTTMATITQQYFKKSMMWNTLEIKGTIMERCISLKEAGFDGIEFDSHMNREECIAALKATGLKASSVCNSKHWDIPLSSLDHKVRQEGIDAMVVAMEDAMAYGTDAVLLVPGCVDANTSYDECWERSTQAIKQLVPIATKMGVTICIENVWNNFLLSPMEAVLYIDQFKSDRVKFYFDCGNIIPYGWPEQWIKILGDRVCRIHIKEYSTTIANKQGKWAGFKAPLCEGSIDWVKVVEALEKSGYRSWLTIEHHGTDTFEGLKDMGVRLDNIIAKKI